MSPEKWESPVERRASTSSTLVLQHKRPRQSQSRGTTRRAPEARAIYNAPQERVDKQRRHHEAERDPEALGRHAVPELLLRLQRVVARNEQHACEEGQGTVQGRGRVCRAGVAVLYALEVRFARKRLMRKKVRGCKEGRGLTARGQGGEVVRLSLFMRERGRARSRTLLSRTVRTDTGIRGRRQWAAVVMGAEDNSPGNGQSLEVCLVG